MGLEGSPCDTLYNSKNEQPATKIQQLKLSPNPTSSTLIVDYGFLDWSGLKYLHLSITNSLGQSLMEAPIPDYSAIQRLDVHALSNGIYRLNISAAGRLLMSSSFVKE